MLLSMNVFLDHQTTRPKFLHFPSSCHGRRTPHKPPLLVSFPAKTEFNLKFLHSAGKSFLVSPATMEFNPKFLHSVSKSVLVSPATMKFRPVLFALPRDNEEFSSDNEEEEELIIQEHGGALILSDNGEYVDREAKLDEEFSASAPLTAGAVRVDGNEDDYTWERPDVGCIKMNSDASIKNLKDETYYTKGAVIFRDSDAELLCGCCFIYEDLNLKTFDSDLVERLTVQRGLEKAIEFGFKWIWAEVDNTNVPKQINEGTDVAKPILDLIEKHSIKFKITSIKKDGNGAAHCLVSKAFNSNFDFTDPSIVSKTLIKKLKNDKAGVVRRR